MIVSVKGAELFYSTQGSGPACLVLSGIGTRPYEIQTQRLSDRFRLVYVDLRGSGPMDDMTTEPDQFAETLASWFAEQTG